MFNPFARARQGSILGMLGSLGQGQNPFANIPGQEQMAPTPSVSDGMIPSGNMAQPPVFNIQPQTDPRKLAYRQGIHSIESAGTKDPYMAMGAVTDSGDRAYGKYQVMGNNIPTWTKEALGVELTPAQFLRSQEAQDAVFDHRFGQYVDKYGEEAAAQAWLGGEGSIGKEGRADMHGTTVGSYGKRFMSALGGANTGFTYANEKGNANPAYTRALTTPLPGFKGLDRPTRDGTEGMTAGGSSQRPSSRQPELQPARAEEPQVGPTYDYGAEEVQGAASEALSRSKQGSQRAAQRRELLKRRLRNET